MKNSTSRTLGLLLLAATFLAVTLLAACSSSEKPTGPALEPAPWTGEVSVHDEAGIAIPGLMVTLEYATQDLPKKTEDAVNIASAEVSRFTDHDGIAHTETVDLSSLWIHRVRVYAPDETLLFEQGLLRTNESSLGDVDPTQYRFSLTVPVTYEVSSTRDSLAAASLIGTWRTAFTDDGINFGRELTYHDNGRFTGTLTQDGNRFDVAGDWVVRNLILTTAFDFNGRLERHSTRFEVSGTTMTTTGIPAGTARHWTRQ